MRNPKRRQAPVFSDFVLPMRAKGTGAARSGSDSGTRTELDASLAVEVGEDLDRSAQVAGLLSADLDRQHMDGLADVGVVLDAQEGVSALDRRDLERLDAANDHLSLRFAAEFHLSQRHGRRVDAQ